MGPGVLPLLREALAPQYRHLPGEDIEGLLESVGLSALDMEFNLGRALSDVGRAVASVAPAVLPVAGTVLGTIAGGPMGGAIGGTLGQLAGGAIGAATRPSSPPRPPRPLPPSASPLRAVPAQLPAAGGSPAAFQLMNLLNRPEIVRSLQSMAMGALGSPNVQVGATPVPVGAFANLIGTLANQAAAEHHAVVAGTSTAPPAYLLDGAGELAVDPAVPEQRAERLLELLDEAWAWESASWATEAFEEDVEDVESEFEAELYELLDAFDD